MKSATILFGSIFSFLFSVNANSNSNQFEKNIILSADANCSYQATENLFQKDRLEIINERLKAAEGQTTYLKVFADGVSFQVLDNKSKKSLIDSSKVKKIYFDKKNNVYLGYSVSKTGNVLTQNLNHNSLLLSETDYKNSIISIACNFDKSIDLDKLNTQILEMKKTLKIKTCSDYIRDNNEI